MTRQASDSMDGFMVIASFWKWFFFLHFLRVDMYVGVRGRAHTTVPVEVRGQHTERFFPSIIWVLEDQTQVKWRRSQCLHHWGILWTQDHYSILILEIDRP